MKKILLSSIKSFLIFISGFLGLLLVYLSFAFILSIIPVNKNFTETKESGIVIYLLTNGVHLDIVVPKVSNYKDWREDLEINPFIDTQVNLVAFGWGDRDFYLNTPEWSDLTFSTAFNALFLKDSWPPRRGSTAGRRPTSSRCTTRPPRRTGSRPRSRCPPR